MIYNESDNSLYPQLEIGTNPFYHKMIFFTLKVKWYENSFSNFYFLVAYLFSLAVTYSYLLFLQIRLSQFNASVTQLVIT